jgi:hypothetical protein
MGQKGEKLMMEEFEKIKKELAELATVLNAFKSEAVQLRILDLVIGQKVTEEAHHANIGKTATRTGVRRTPKGESAPTPGPSKRKKSLGGTGAVATLTQLLSGSFFDKAHTINDIIDHCRVNMARTFKANEFSGKLGRLVRNGTLTRKKNADKQYEYKKP